MRKEKENLWEIKGEKGLLSIAFIQYENEHALSKDDENWVRCRVYAVSEGFSAEKALSLTTEEIEALFLSIKSLLLEEKRINFESLEGDLILDLTMSLTGYITVEVKVSRLGEENATLSFKFLLDRITLEGSLLDLQEAVKTFHIKS